ncbi:MAG: hypothetical protein ACRCSI_02780, partial [Eubacterium aggregans]
MLNAFALGQDVSSVRPFNEALGDTKRLVKFIGNGYTAPRDLETREDVKMMTTILSESVAARLRTAGLLAQTLSLHLRDKQLHSITRQKKFAAPSDITEEFITTAMAIFDANYFFHSPIRSMSIQACDLVDPVWGTQIDFFYRSGGQRAYRPVGPNHRRFAHTLRQPGRTAGHHHGR